MPDFSISGVDEVEAESLNNALLGVAATAVAATKRTLITAADLRSLIDHEYKKSVLACESDEACLSEIAGALGADLLLQGSVGKVESTYSLSLVLLDTRSASVVRRFQGTAGSSRALLLTVERGVQELFDEQARTARSGLVLVKTIPPGASIYIDGERVGTSPFNAEIDLGEHEVRAELGELAGSEIVFVEPQGVTRVQLDMKQPLVEALFLSDPPEARVYIDGAYAGETPLRVRELRSGEREVVVELDGYLTDRRQMAVSRAEYELRGREPFRYEVELKRRWPVEPGVGIGMIGTASKPSDGLGFYVDLTADLWDWLQLAVGYVNPTAWTAGARVFVLRDSFELGIVARGIAFRRRAVADDGPFQPAVEGGLSAGYVLRTPAGRVGVRIEPTVSLDIERRRIAFPVIAAMTWAWR